MALRLCGGMGWNCFLWDGTTELHASRGGEGTTRSEPPSLSTPSSRCTRSRKTPSRGTLGAAIPSRQSSTSPSSSATLSRLWWVACWMAACSASRGRDGGATTFLPSGWWQTHLFGDTLVCRQTPSWWLPRPALPNCGGCSVRSSNFEPWHRNWPRTGEPGSYGYYVAPPSSPSTRWPSGSGSSRATLWDLVSCPVPHTGTSGGRTGKTMASPPARFRQAVGPTTSPAQGTLSAYGWIAAWSTNFSGHALHAHHWWPWPYGTPRTSPRGMESEHLPDTYCQTASSA